MVEDDGEVELGVEDCWEGDAAVVYCCCDWVVLVDLFLWVSWHLEGQGGDLERRDRSDLE